MHIGSTAPHATTNQGSFKKKFYRCSLLHNVVSRNYHNEIVPRCVPWDSTADVECTYHPLQLEKWQPAAIRLPFRKHLTFYKDLRDTYRRGITRTSTVTATTQTQQFLRDISMTLLCTFELGKTTSCCFPNRSQLMGGKCNHNKGQ